MSFGEENHPHRDLRFSYLLSGVLFILALVWFSRGLVFASYYHPDEVNKVIQIQTHYRNFNHPQLLLNSAAALYRLGGSPESKLQTAVLTRWVSVFFAAMTVVLLAYTAFLLAGPVAQICCGWLLLTKPILFELAHYLKEDPALSMGFAAIYLSFLLYAWKPTPARATLVGLAAALAISAKYIGVFPALLALAGVAWQGRGKPRHLLHFAIACLLLTAAINWQNLIQLTQFRTSLGREVGIFAEKSSSLLNDKNTNAVFAEIGVLAWLALAAWLASPLYRKKPLGAGEWLILAATFGYAVMLLFSSRSANRYLLPVATALPMIISVAACWVGQSVAILLKQTPRLVQTALCLPVVLLYGARDLPGVRDLYAGFHSDNRRDLVEFLRAKLPANAILAEDDDVKLPDGTPRRNYDGWNLTLTKVRPEKHPHLGDEFTLPELRARSVTHVALFLDSPTSAALKGNKLKARDEKLGRFLKDLTSTGHLLWSCDSSAPGYLHPPLQLYELTPGRSGNAQ